MATMLVRATRPALSAGAVAAVRSVSFLLLNPNITAEIWQRIVGIRHAAATHHSIMRLI